MRNGVPLPGVTPVEVVSQLAYRTFGPLHRHRVLAVLDYHGAAGRVAGTLAETAARHSVTTVTVSNRVRAVRVAGADLPLTPALITAATRRSHSGEDHLGRVRLARTLGLPPPKAPPVRPAPSEETPSPAAMSAARAAGRILAAVGPQDLDTLLAAVTRSHRFRRRMPLPATDLAAALIAIGATMALDDRWRPPPEVSPPDKYRTIVTAVAGRELTRAQMIDILITAGYSRSSAAGRMSTSHP
ncbi:MAG: hypothetical protein ABJD68_07045, partial [Nakamurella sp.]